MKNILIVTSSDFPYGAPSSKLLRLIGAGLAEKGYQVEVLLQRGRQTKSEKMILEHKGIESGVIYRFLGWKLRPRSFILKVLDSLIANIRVVMILILRKTQGKADVVMVYNHSGIQNLPSLITCKILRILCVSYVSDWLNQNASFPKWYQKPKWWDFLFRMKIVNPWFDGLIMPSYFLRNYYLGKEIRSARLYILPTLVELPNTLYAEDFLEYPKKAKIRIGFCGKPTWTNGGEMLIHIFKKVVSKYPSSELIVMGDRLDNPKLLPGLKKMAKEFKLDEKIIFTGMIPQSQVAKVLLTCDILVLPRPAGTFAEAGFPTKLGEYVASRKPVVVSKVGDIPHYLKHKHSAMLAEPGNIDEFAEHILWLIKHPNESMEIAQEGFKWAKESLSYQGATNGLVKFLNSLSKTRK